VKRWLRRIGLATAPVVLFGAVSAYAAGEGVVQDPGVLGFAAGRLRADTTDTKNLVVVARAAAEFRQTGQLFDAFKVLDTGTGKVVGVSRGKDNRLAEAKAAEALIRAAEIAALNRSYGKLEPALVGRLARQSRRSNVPVAIWVKAPDLDAIAAQLAKDFPKEIDPKQFGTRVGLESVAEASADNIQRRFEQLLQEAQGRQSQGVAALALQRGAKVAKASGRAPVVLAQLPRVAIEEMARRSDVVFIFLAGGRIKADLDVSVPALSVDDVWTAGHTGTDIKVGIVEGGAVDFTNANLQQPDGSAGGLNRPGVGVWDDHTTGVAGIISSQHGTRTGVAKGVISSGANIISAPIDYSDEDVAEALEWAVDQGARVIDNS